MELPILEPAPVVSKHAAVFRDLFDKQCQCRHFQHDLTGLIVLPNKSLANIARGIRERPDKINLSRLFSEAPWRAEEINGRRIPVAIVRRARPSMRRCANTWAVCWTTWTATTTTARGPIPWHIIRVTSFSVSGPVRCPVGLRLHRRDEELTQWEAAVAKHVPDLQIPTAKQGRNRLQKEVVPVLLQDPEFRARHAQFRTTIALAIALVEDALRHTVPCGVVVFDAWALAEDLIQVLTRRRRDWISVLKTNRLVETASFQLRDTNGGTLKLPGPHLAVEALVPLIPAKAYRPVKVGAHTSWCCTLTVRLPTLGKVRIVVSVGQESLTGRGMVLVTNRLDWTAAQIIGLYVPRWPTATLDQDGKGHLGFNAYRLRSAEAMGQHGCRVFVADSLRPLTCVPAGPDRTQGLIHTMGDACRQQGRALLQQLLLFVHEQLSGGAAADHVFAQFFAKQGGIVLV